MKFLDKNFSIKFSDKFLDALSDDTVTLGELDELIMTRKAFDELTDFDEKNIKKWLKKENLTVEILLKQRDDRGKQLRQLANTLDYPIDNSFEVCIKLGDEVSYTEEIGQFLRLFLPSHKFILNPKFQTNEDVMEQISNYGLILDEIEEVHQILSKIESLWENWKILKPQLLNRKKPDVLKTNVNKDELIKVISKHLGIPSDSENFAYNVESLISDINQVESFRKIAPLYFFKVATKHKSRLKNNKDLSFNLNALWDYTEYKLGEDNGRNHTTNSHYVSLFDDLCILFQKDTMVNIPLSEWGFYQLSNLLEFDRMRLEHKTDSLFPLYDELLESSLFSCYRCGPYDAVLLKYLNMTLEKVVFFQSIPQYQEVLTNVFDCLNEDSKTWVEKFLLCDTEEVYELCLEIFKNSKKTEKKLSFNDRKLNLLLCAINLALQELVDLYAKEFIVQGLISMFRENVERTQK